MKSFLNITALFLITSLIAGCGGSMKLNSKRPDSEVIADGEIAEWKNNLNYIKDKNVSIGFYNDDNFLYISLKTTDRSIIQQAMGRGLTVWLDGKGGGDKNFGIRFPIGRMGGAFMGERSPRSERPEAPDFGEMDQRFREQLTIYELVAPGEKEPRLFNTDEVNGIRMQIKLNRDEGLVYELQVPLQSTEQNPYGIKVKGDQVGVGFEAAKLDMEEFRDQRGTGGDMGGRGPAGGFGGMSGGRGAPGMGRVGMFEQFKLWTKVTLESKNTPK